MKRSNRLVLLIGILLAAVAFGSVILLFNQKQDPTTAAPTELDTVYAKADISLGTVITRDLVEARKLNLAIRPADAFGDIGLVVGKTVRTEIKNGALLSPSDFSAGAGGSGQDVARLLDPGLRAIAVQVDQSTGVGTLINVGDRVDMVVGLTGADKFPLVALDPVTELIGPITGYNSTTTKLVLQNMQVIGTLVPPPPAATAGQPAASEAPTSFTGQQELVILAVTPQQAEVIKFAQVDGGSISLVLRSPKDFADAEGNPIVPPLATTSGVVLKTLIDEFGVLPPQQIPAQTLPPTP